MAIVLDSVHVFFLNVLDNDRYYFFIVSITIFTEIKNTKQTVLTKKVRTVCLVRFFFWKATHFTNSSVRCFKEAPAPSILRGAGASCAPFDGGQT
jgi:hypothetical protein